MRVANKRCRYICSIHEVNGLPEFRVLVSEPSQEDVELRDTTAKGVWQQILEPMQALRRANSNINIFPKYISGEDLFGLTEPAIVRILESLPGMFCFILFFSFIDLYWSLNHETCSRPFISW